jgi:dTDP-4-amino-4,6-dideoxygalactose transaminase
VRDEILAAWERVYDSGRFVNGPELEAFEAELADYVGVEYAIGVSSGTAALELILKACGIRGEVLVPALTFVGTAEAVVNAGATPVFTDVDPETWTMTVETAEPHVTAKTEAIIPVHLFGNPAPVRTPWSEVIDGPIIEDACQAIGSTYRGKMCGSLGHAAAFSFYPTKNLPACGDAGAVTTNSSFLAGEIRALRHHEAVGGGTHRMDELQAAVLRIRLRGLPARFQRGGYTQQKPTPHSEPLWHKNVSLGPRARAHDAPRYYDPPLHKDERMEQFWRCDLPFAERFARENWEPRMVELRA